MAPLRILIVEDNALIGMLLGETLRAMGHDACAVVHTEADAVDTALRLRPDLMIVDAKLGTGNGLTAVETVLRTMHVPHLFMSGAPLETGSVGGQVLRKPFLEAELAQAIEAAVAGVNA